MRKILLETKDGDKEYKVFYCVGCRKYHRLQINPNIKPNFKFNGDLQKPTFHPALLIKDVEGNVVCHSVVENGTIRYFDEGIHDLIGMTVPMSEV